MSRRTKLLKSHDTPNLCDDQQKVFDEYFHAGRVCVDAGAGTGKTTTLIEIAAEVVVEQLEAGIRNPFERMLLVTFGVEASRKLMIELRNRLEDHKKAGGRLPERVWRLIEAQSNIRTIDSLIQSLLREIAVQLGISLSIEIPGGLDQERLRGDIFRTLRSERALADSWQNVDTAYPEVQWEYGPESIEEMIWNTHQKLREFCWRVDELEGRLLESLRQMHAGFRSPFSIPDLESILRLQRGNTADLIFSEISQSQLLAIASQSYENSATLISDFGKILKRFDEEYSKRTRSQGSFTYIDIAYLVWQYLNSQEGKRWKEALAQRYDHLLVDEYQDTSHVQNEILGAFVRNSGESDTKVLLIGDVKQSIYQWRSAEPRIFQQLIDCLRKKPPDPTPPFTGMVRHPIVTNFRSDPQLIQFFNCTFSKLFVDRNRGQIAGPISYENLIAFHKPLGSASDAHVHVILNPATSVKSWVDSEVGAIAGFIADLVRKGSLRIRERMVELRDCQLGDVTLLFRRTTYMSYYVNALRQSGIKCAVLSDVSLFGEVEVSLVIDMLDWFANPDSKDALLRILRSPVVALADETLRYIVNKKLFLTSAVSDWPDADLPQGDKQRLSNLIKLRNDLRWDREGPKADLVSKVIAHGFLDSVVAASVSGLQAQANLWLLTEVVSAWEEEELVPYREFVERLKALRERASREAGREYPRAIMADETSSDCVKIMTVHAAKGLQFPIVILPESIVTSGSMELNKRMLRDRIHGMALKPRPPEGLDTDKSCIMSKPNDHKLKWISSTEGESLLWTSTERDPVTGELLAKGRIQNALREEFAEFWRLLYVASTRAKDHLVFSVGSEPTPSQHRKNEFQWVSWMPFLREVVEYKRLQPNATTVLKMSVDASGTKQDVSIHLYEPFPMPAAKPVSFPDVAVGTKPPPTTALPPMFVPSSLSPSSCGELVECPRRFQYATLWQVTGIGERRMRHALGMSLDFPDGMSADTFGRLTHELLANRDFVKAARADNTVARRLDPTTSSLLGRKLTDKQRTELLTAVANLEQLPIFKQIQSSAKAGARVYREYRADAMLVVQNLPPIPVSGSFDLLFEGNGNSWLLVDYKAEPKPATGSYQERLHKLQLQSYAWLAKESLRIKITEAILAYLYPKPEEHRFAPTLDAFSLSISKVLSDLKLDPKKGLEAKPNTSPAGCCYLCPYRDRIGGPCENGS